MRRPALVLVLLGLGLGAEAQRKPPADTTGMIEPDGRLTLFDPVSGARDTTGYLIYPDSTIGVFAYGGDTAYVDPSVLPFLSDVAEAHIADEPSPGYYFDVQVTDEGVELFALRTLPLPVAVGLGLGVPLLVLAVLVFLVRRLRQERRQRRLLQETARRLSQSREDERLRIARDLHDGPLQDLQALHMQLGVAVDALPDAGATGGLRLRGALDEVHTVIGELRGLTQSLRPPALGPFGLAAALRAHADRFRRHHPDVAVDLALDDDDQQLPEPVRLALFRVAQEAMNNAVKHGRPGQITVSLRLAPKHVDLAIQDDGTGLIDAAGPAAEGHYGILGMRERIDAVGGPRPHHEPRRRRRPCPCPGPTPHPGRPPRRGAWTRVSTGRDLRLALVPNAGASPGRENVAEPRTAHHPPRRLPKGGAAGEERTHRPHDRPRGHDGRRNGVSNSLAPTQQADRPPKEPPPGTRAPTIEGAGRESYLGRGAAR